MRLCCETGLPLRRAAATLAAMDMWQDLDDRLRAQAAKGDASGSVLLTQAGHTLFHGCYGLADRAAAVAVGPGTRFGLASVTKMFTAVAVADQV